MSLLLDLFFFPQILRTWEFCQCHHSSKYRRLKGYSIDFWVAPTLSQDTCERQIENPMMVPIQSHENCSPGVCAKKVFGFTSWVCGLLNTHSIVSPAGSVCEFLLGAFFSLSSRKVLKPPWIKKS